MLRGVVVPLLLTCLYAAGCSEDRGGDAAEALPDSITVTSSALRDGEAVPVRFTCDGEELSPPLAWEGVAADAEALALVVDDPDAPDGTFVHWVVLDIPADVASIEEGQVPRGSVQAANSAGEPAYAGPCPPSGTHNYRFIVYALSATTGLEEGVDLDQALDAIDQGAVARGAMVGTYERVQQ